jgi:hypothetical protein
MPRKKKQPDIGNSTLIDLVKKQEAVDTVEDLTFDRLKNLADEKKPAKLRLRR